MCSSCPSRGYEHEVPKLRSNRSGPRHPRHTLHAQGRNDFHFGRDGRLLPSVRRSGPRLGGILPDQCGDGGIQNAGDEHGIYPENDQIGKNRINILGVSVFHD